MKDKEKTKEQLLKELKELRQRIAELETLEAKRKQAEDALHDSEDKYRTIFETTGTATIIIEEDTTISLANKNFTKLSGYTQEEIEGKKSWTDFIAHKEDLDRMKDYHNARRIDPDAAPRNYEFKFINKKGAVKDILTTAAVIPGTKKSVGSFLDITDRKQAEEALQKSERHFRDVVENSLTGISIIQDNKVVYQNPEQERLIGLLLESLDSSAFDIIHPDDVAKLKKLYQKIISGEVRTLDTDFRYYPEGKIDSAEDMKWVYCRASLIEYQGKGSVLVNMMDMTKPKKLEHLLIIQDKMSSLGRVAAGIAHEIRNPLSGINIYLSTLQKIYDRADSLDKVKGILEQLQSASGKIESVIRRVMDFSKPGEPKFVPTNINQPIEEAIQLSSVTLRKSEIKLEKELSKDLPQCNADPHLIEEVILNLITNAAEAMKGIEFDKKIEITSSMGNKRILVKISDSGPGVPSNLKGKIFDPFYTTKDGSTGIGLSLSHRVITDHGGSLSVGQSKWGGAEFIIEIPLEK
jgi:PAS domain S-box-containing protein